MSTMSSPSPLSESQLIASFHSFLKGALSQAHAERLLSDDMLQSAEADLMVQGPALCLFFAALRSSTSPPSVTLPSSPPSPPLQLTLTTCPPHFLPLFQLWSSTVPHIRALPPGYQHDLARLICDLEPLTSPVRESLSRLAAELRAVAIEISQRRTFQERYRGDLQAVLDRAGGGRTSWEAPPGYVPALEEKPLPPPPPPVGVELGEKLQVPLSPGRPASPGAGPGAKLNPPPSPRRRTPSRSGKPGPLPSPDPIPSTKLQVPPSPHTPTRPASPLSSPTTPSPILALIRETLYAALADQFSHIPQLHQLLTSDPAQAYFSSVSLSILQVCLTRITHDGEVLGVLDRPIREEDVSREYRPFMAQLVRIALRAQILGEEDDARAIRYAAQDREIPIPRLERLRTQLLQGTGEGEGDGDGGRPQSPGGTVLALANRINVLALTWVGLGAFRDRQGEVFDVLRGVR
ncbi:hypothetical protein DACRYDRAFT_96806 [Dacryopinax primogenitus]|uniref:Uncharacterized protein n=1 Tax=Dacryopinax primogenitus (strain DJM 731) TaxID=1858805 RepID=M5FSQ8_DACPD|nr:uncharacterized protein DACRYDRAFT_96806 [Dacryopinax primogenitus]EJT98269.1 hypothetical protein DACRYDRAFT_96806 [Dacryopinax primogenitus]